MVPGWGPALQRGLLFCQRLQGFKSRRHPYPLYSTYQGGPGMFSVKQGCIFRLTCSHPELTKDHVITSAYVKIFRTVTRNAANKNVWRKKDCSWLPLKKCNEHLYLNINKCKKTSPYSPRASNLLHMLQSRMVGWNELWNPAKWCIDTPQ